MLEGFLRKKAEKRGIVLHVESVGTHWSAKYRFRPSRPTRTCMESRGIELNGFRSRHIDAIDLSLFDLVIAVAPDIALQVKLRGYGGNLAVENVPNPFGRNVATYEKCAEQLEQIAERIVGAL